jgi:hypothetical protein
MTAHLKTVLLLSTCLLTGLRSESAADVSIYVTPAHPSASDANSGLSSNSPLSTISAALSKATPYLQGGTPVLIAASSGTYREKLSLSATGAATNTPLTIKGDPLGGTRITGTFSAGFEAENWTPVPGKTNIYEHAWPYQYGLDTGFWADSLGKVPEGPALRREMVFIDDIMLMPRALDTYTWEDSDGPGGTPGALVYQGIATNGLGVLDEDWTFAVSDHAASPAAYQAKLFLRLPEGINITTLNRIEVSRDEKPELLYVADKHNLTLRNLSFEGAGTKMTGSAVTLSSCRDALLEDCTISFNNGQGLNSSAACPGLTVRRCTFNNNGLKGAGRGFSNALFIDTEFSFNCWLAELGNFLNFDAAGIKIGASSENVLLKRCIAVGNRDNGFWNDVASKNIRYEQCFSYKNANNGIFLEYSGDDFTRGDDSAYQCVSARNGVGIYFSNARRPLADTCLTLNNTKAEFRQSFITTRNPNTASDYDSMTITNCRMYNQVGGQVLITGEAYHQPDALSAMVLAGNQYSSSSPGTAFEAADLPPTSLANWETYMISQGASIDATLDSSITTIPDYASDPYDFYPGSALSTIAEGWDVTIPYEYIWPDRGPFVYSMDIGTPERPGHAAHNEGMFVVVGGGTGASGTNDSIHFLSHVATNDIDMIVRIADLETTETGSRAGLMLRESAYPGAISASIMITEAGDAVFSYRAQSNQPAIESISAGHSRNSWLRLQRSGNILTGYVSPDADDWQVIGSGSANAAPEILAGLFATAQDNTVQATVLFDGFQADYNPTLIAGYAMGTNIPTTETMHLTTSPLAYTGDGIGLFDKTLASDPTPNQTQPYFQGYLTGGTLSFILTPDEGFLTYYEALALEMQIQGYNRWVELTSSATGTNVLWTLRGAANDGDPIDADVDLGGAFKAAEVDLSVFPELQGIADPVTFTFTYRSKPTETDKKNWRIDNLSIEGTVALPPATAYNITFTRNANDFQASWQGTPGTTYTLQHKANLQDAVWSNITENIPGTNAIMSITISPEEPKAFFRIIAQ